MKKIGLSLAFTGTNYGALWQAYATQHKIQEMGFVTEIIDYHKGKKHEYVHCPEAYVGHILEIISERRDKRRNPPIALDEIHRRNIAERKNVADDFRTRRLENIVSIKGLEELREYCINNYCAVLVGSDQLWLPMAAFTYFRTLRFAPEGIRKISYATSLGVSAYPKYSWRMAKQYWNEIDYLSVREQQGANIVREISGRDPQVVLDPTYLYSKVEWEKLVQPEKIAKDGYVLAFILGDNQAMKKLAYEYAKKKGLRVVCIMSNAVCVDDSKYADEILTGQRPENFINLIRNAECIFTDSFHGLAFSIINEKQVYITYRVRVGTASRNSRIDDIVKSYGIEHRLIKNPDAESPSEGQIDYTYVNSIIEKKRTKSLQFLNDALNGL